MRLLWTSLDHRHGILFVLEPSRVGNSRLSLYSHMSKGRQYALTHTTSQASTWCYLQCSTHHCCQWFSCATRFGHALLCALQQWLFLPWCIWHLTLRTCLQRKDCWRHFTLDSSNPALFGKMKGGGKETGQDPGGDHQPDYAHNTALNLTKLRLCWGYMLIHLLRSMVKKVEVTTMLKNELIYIYET